MFPPVLYRGLKLEIVVTERAEKDLKRMPDRIVETFLSKKSDVEKNLQIGADSSMVFDKYLSGNMHPVLQMNLGRDFRAWFIEGRYLERSRDDRIFTWRVLRKKEAKKIIRKIEDPISYFQPSHG